MTIATTHEDKMWNIIGALGWVESGYNYETVSQMLKDNYSNEIVRSLASFVNDRVNELMERVESWEALHGRMGDWDGDASFSTAIFDVVGMGKLTFDTIMSQPARFEGIKGDNRFQYVIPVEVEIEHSMHN